MALYESKNGPGSQSVTAITNIYTPGGCPATNTTGTDTAGIIGTVWVSAINIPAPITVTGISYLIGSVGGTDKAIVFVFDSAGNVLATSALAGTTVGTTATMQRIALNAPLPLNAPGLYFIGVQTNGTTARIRTQAFGDYPVASISQTFGTPVAITVPTTFTASYGPIASTY
jgi:hypothetical protein